MAGLQRLIVTVAFVGGGSDVFQGLGILIQLQRKSSQQTPWTLQHMREQMTQCLRSVHDLRYVLH